MARPFNLIANGYTDDGARVLRIRNETGETQDFRLYKAGGGFDEIISVPPGAGTFETDYFVKVLSPGTYKLELASGGGSVTKSTDNSGTNLYTGEFDYIEGVGPVCFVAGTPIRTEHGDVAVEAIRPGDRVLCRNGKLHRVRWVGHRRIDGRGPFAPITIAAGLFGNRRALSFSPAHRICISNWRTACLFDTAEVLVAVQDLTGIPGVDRRPCAMVDYHHILLDTHQTVLSAGLWSETFNPSHDYGALDRRSLAELRALFPEFGSGPVAPTSLPSLSPADADLLARPL